LTQYIPLLRFKRGELNALRALQTTTKSGVTPYLDISGDRFREKTATKTKPAVSAPDHVVERIKIDWGKSPIIVDAAKVAGASGSPHPIEEIADAASAAGITVVPAAQLSAPVSYQKAVENVQKKHGNGVCLKVDLDEMTSASSWTSTLPFAPGEVDLLVDFSSNVGTVSGLGKSLISEFQGLHAGSAWRSVTVAGSSMPENFSGYTKGTYLLNREEYALWNRLMSASLPYDLDYGDYATVAVTAPASGIAWGFPINVRYSLDDEFLICRGVRTVGPTAVDLDVQLIGHAKDIVAHPKRSTIAGCWADQKINSIAASGVGQGNLETWVKIGVNRHIELVNQLLP
jgi:hypothetical protein